MVPKVVLSDETENGAATVAVMFAVRFMPVIPMVKTSFASLMSFKNDISVSPALIVGTVGIFSIVRSTWSFSPPYETVNVYIFPASKA